MITSTEKVTMGERMLTQHDINGFENVLRHTGPVDTLDRVGSYLRTRSIVAAERGDMVGSKALYAESVLVIRAALAIQKMRSSA